MSVNFEEMNIKEKYEEILVGYVGIHDREEVVDELLNLHLVSKSLPTKEDVIAEGDKQIEDWLSENHYMEQRAYRVAFRRSYEYVLRFLK